MILQARENRVSNSPEGIAIDTGKIRPPTGLGSRGRGPRALVRGVRWSGPLG